MSTMQAVTNALIEINGAVFQELCDSFLIMRNTNYSAFSRIGSQSTKQKTTIGTPDTLFLLPNRKYICVEHTTVSSSRLKKLKSDISDCLNISKTEIPINKIEKIILCFNFNLKVSEIQELQNLVSQTNIILKLYNLDSLATELLLNHKNLIHRYLDLPLDTGQVVSLEHFIEEYNKASKGIATPLDNRFFHRDDELQKIKLLLNDSDFIILTGKPGVGKTKLGIEAIKNFVIDNKSYNSYCISYKNYELLNDLYQYFDKDKDYIIFVDDANRIDAFDQITGFYKTKRNGNLKIIITVRDYAFQKIKKRCQEFSPKEIYLSKLSDEEIIDIIKNDPFNILNSDYHKEILRIANGNPRLAIMVSKLAIEEQNIYALSDVSDLFDKYFSTFIKDDGEFSNKTNLKCLGLIAFFHALPYNDKTTISSILEIFKISYSEFINSIDILERLELVELQFEYVKIPEQNLSTYFFYKSFVKNNILSFSDLLFNYFDNKSDRFRDCIIPANNTFGPQNVMEKLKPELQSYWLNINNNDIKAYNFLKTFWYYLQEETIEFVYNKIQKISKTEVIEYDTEYEMNDFAYNNNEIIELLGNFFRLNHHLKDVIELAFEYAKKEPKHLPELIHKIRKELTFDKNDERSGFQRQKILFDMIIKKLEINDQIYVEAFYELSKTFLNYTFEHTEGGRNHKFYFYRYRIPNNDFIQKIRTNIWNCIDENFNSYPEKSLEVIKSYSDPTPDVIKEIMEFDLPFVLNIINQHLSNMSFEYCYYVQEQIKWFEKNSVTHNSFEELKENFINSTYELFLKIDWNRFRGKEIYEFENHKEFEQLKEIDIRKEFVFNSIKEFKAFYSKFVYLINWKDDIWNYNKTMDIIIDENFSNDYMLGIKILEFIINQENLTSYIPTKVFNNQLNKQQKIKNIWELIQNNSYNKYIKWRLSFHYYIEDEFINQNEANNVIETINQISDDIFIDFAQLECYITVDPTLFQKIFKIITNKIDKDNIRITFWIDFFSENFNLLGDDIDLIKRLYLQQNQLQQSFDYKGEILLEISRTDSEFLFEYVENVYSAKKYGDYLNHKKLSLAWSLDGIEDIISKVIDLIIYKQEYLNLGKNFSNAFFINLEKDEWKVKADNFILNYIRNNNNSIDKMNVIFDVIRTSREDLFEEALKLFVSLNQDIELFSKIVWENNFGTYSGDIIIGDVKATEWKNILSIIEKVDIGIKSIPIKNYIKRKIKAYLDSGNIERKRRFLGNH